MLIHDVGRGEAGSAGVNVKLSERLGVSRVRPISEVNRDVSRNSCNTL